MSSEPVKAVVPPRRPARVGVLTRLKRVLGTILTYALLVVAGGLLAILCSYLMRQFGY